MAMLWRSVAVASATKTTRVPNQIFQLSAVDQIIIDHVTTNLREPSLAQPAWSTKPAHKHTSVSHIHIYVYETHRSRSWMYARHRHRGPGSVMEILMTSVYCGCVPPHIRYHTPPRAL
jgi:hypothetical protein